MQMCECLFYYFTHSQCVAAEIIIQGNSRSADKSSTEALL